MSVGSYDGVGTSFLSHVGRSRGIIQRRILEICKWSWWIFLEMEVSRLLICSYYNRILGFLLDNLNTCSLASWNSLSWSTYSYVLQFQGTDKIEKFTMWNGSRSLASGGQCNESLPTIVLWAQLFSRTLLIQKIARTMAVPPTNDGRGPTPWPSAQCRRS